MNDNIDLFTDVELSENTLYTTPAEREALVKDKARVAAALMFNFFGVLGMINATKPSQKATVMSFLKKDKKLRLSSIDDTNHDISLSVKLAHEAGFFVNDTIVNNITMFLVKLKAGQIDHIDSAVVGKWAAGLKPDFANSMTNAKMKTAFNEFRTDEGKTIDVSRFAIVLKSLANKMDDSGEFKLFSKKFFGLTEVSPSATAAGAVAVPAAPAAPAVPGKMNYYQRQREIKLAAAAAEAKKVADAKAAADLIAKQKQDEADRIANMQKSVPADHVWKLIRACFHDGSIASSKLYNPARVLLDLFGFTTPPNVYVTAVEKLRELLTALNGNISNSYSAVEDSADTLKDLLGEFNNVTKHEITLLELLLASVEGVKAPFNDAISRRVIMCVVGGIELNKDVYDRTMAKMGSTGWERACIIFGDNDSLTKKITSIIASDRDNYTMLCNAKQGPIYEGMSVSQAWTGPAVYRSSSWAREPDSAFKFVMGLIQKYPGTFTELLLTILSVNGRYYDDQIGGWLAAFCNPHTEIKEMPSNHVAKLKLLFVEAVTTNFDEILRKHPRTVVVSIISHRGVTVYNESAGDKGGPLAEALHEHYAADVYKNGWENSKIRALTGVDVTDYNAKYVMGSIGVDSSKLIQVRPDDPSSMYLRAVKDGIGSLTPEQIGKTIAHHSPTDSIGSLTKTATKIFTTAAGPRDENADALTMGLLDLAKKSPDKFDGKVAGEYLMNMLPNTTQATTNAWLKFAREKNNEWIMGGKLYKEIDRSNKQRYVDTLTGIVQDSIGSDIEDYVNNIVDSMPTHVVQKMRANLVGASVIISEIDNSVIKPFDKIDAARLKKIFLYNDLDMSSVVSGVVEKKKKSETYTQYFSRARAAISNVSLLGAPKVDLDTVTPIKATNKAIILRDHAGRHGNVFPKITKIFDAHIGFPEFDKFRADKPKDGSILPAYHGTGGIAAGMILRYGFKVIKSSDPSVVGRMLGDGIYFSNKIDKALQYVSNGGYSRQNGQQGYILEMDTNLGQKQTDYRVAGSTGSGDNIRSPEWCVSDPRAQLKVTRAYEVTLVGKTEVDQYLVEGVQSSGITRFKTYLKEQNMEPVTNVASFVFRDGLIPIVDVETYEIRYVDFEQALSEKLITEDMFEKTSQGPAIVFDSAPVQAVVDERYAGNLGGDDLQLYVELYTNKVRSRVTDK